MVDWNINLTCDTWQASNLDGYFAVTGHWVEEQVPGRWKLEHGLLSFMQMNTSHNVVRLGQALYKICDRLKIVHKVSCVNITLTLISNSRADWPHYLWQCIQQQHNGRLVAILMWGSAISGGYTLDFFTFDIDFSFKVPCTHHQPCNTGPYFNPK